MENFHHPFTANQIIYGDLFFRQVSRNFCAMKYNEIYQYSINEKEKFWAEQAYQLKWFKEPSNILSKNDKGFYRWFADGEMNTCYLCLDHNIEQGRGEQTALI